MLLNFFIADGMQRRNKATVTSLHQTHLLLSYFPLLGCNFALELLNFLSSTGNPSSRWFLGSRWCLFGLCCAWSTHVGDAMLSSSSTIPAPGDAVACGGAAVLAEDAGADAAPAASLLHDSFCFFCNRACACNDLRLC